MVLLLALFFLNMGYCALYKITSKDVTNKQGFTKQPKSIASNGVKSACFLTETTNKISMAEIERSAAIDFNIGLLRNNFITIPGFASADIFTLFKRRSKLPVSPLPLFLQYCRLII